MKYKQSKLKNIADISMGQSPKSEFFNNKKIGIEFLQGVKTFGELYPHYDTYTTNYKKYANKNDILFSVRAPVGMVNFADKKVAIGRGISAIHVHSNFSKKYLFYYLKKISNKLNHVSNGTVFTSINKKELENITINYPEKEEDQKKLANYLSLIDNKILFNNQINDNLVA